MTLEAEELLFFRRSKVALTVILLYELLLFGVFFLEFLSGEGGFYWLGIYPRSARGIVGIVCAPLLHSGWEHLLGNAVGLGVMGYLLLYFYPRWSGWVVLVSWLASGVVCWLVGSPGYHIGASGVVYGMGFFLACRGFREPKKALWAVSLILIFLYGGLLWGIFPGAPGMSWEAHLGGGVGGLLCALLFPLATLPEKEGLWQENPLQYEGIHHTGGEQHRIRWLYKQNNNMG